MKLYRMDYSPYARKVQMVLDLLGYSYEAIDITYGSREEMAKQTGGYVQVPVLVDDDGAVTVESRVICEKLLQRDGGESLAPSPWQGPIWAYADWCDNVLEDVMFRMAAPLQKRRFGSQWESALYVFIKERKFGAGCVDEWERQTPALLAKARALLAPTKETLSRQPFLFGTAPTLADAALYGLFAMFETVDVKLPAQLGEEMPDFQRRVEAARPQR